VGYRNHLLKFRTPETWEILKKAGFKYDSTFGYIDCVGFRNGMCHPFRPYNRETDSYIGIWELPIIVMDSTFDNYMRLSKDDEWNITRHLIDSVSTLNGVISILWHNTNMSGDRFAFYEKILKYCRGKEAWITSGEEIINWWEKKGYMHQ
jgi:peptidoglycan/xylan/chitin deacetylase (PgdA/CDA1 family)